MDSCVIDFIDVILTYLQNSFVGGITLRKAFKITQRVVDVIFIFVLTVIIICGVVCRLLPGEKADYTKTTNTYITEDKALVSAHRSGKDIAPENTMLAFETCIESEDFDVDIFEFDLHITKDGQLILLHDDTLDRTTDSEVVFGDEGIRPSEKTYEELRTLNFGADFCDKDGEYPYRALTGNKIPDNLRAVLLEDVLDYLESNGGFDYIIEIKDGGELGEKATDELYKILKEKDLLDNVVVGTFNNNVTKYMDEKYPDMMRSASIPEVCVFYFATTLNIDVDEGFFKYKALQIPNKGYYVFAFSSERLINYAHKNNIAVQYWTVNDPEDVEKLNELGADCIMSDDPDMAYDIING